MLRSKERYTTGLNIANKTTDHRFFLFEIDLNSKQYIMFPTDASKEDS